MKSKKQILNSSPSLPASYAFGILILAALFFSNSAFADKFVPFVIPAKPNADSPITATSAEPISTDSDRLVVYGSYFSRGDDRVRLWGVNLSFGANMPTHEDATHIAARLAAAGVSAVRCHHMDSARWPRGIWNSEDGKTLEPEALDRLDFFIDQLARRGICVNINLHVGRAHSRFLGLPEPNRKYDKISNIFTPALIDAQKKYARDLLTHVNKYRKVRYADDPAVALIEITNENSFFMWGGEATLRTLPEYYAKILQRKFNAWLKKQYRSDEKLRSTWAEGVQPPGANLLKNGNFQMREVGGAVPLHWSVEQHQGCRAWVSRQRLESRRALKIEIAEADDTEWHLQLNQGSIAVKKGQYYTVTLESAADKPRTITCTVGQAHSPWGNLGLSQRVELAKKRTIFRYGFVVKADDDNARVSFAFGGSDIPIWLANVEFRPGGRVGLQEGESIEQGNVTLFAETESPNRMLDRMKFLAETEKAYFDDMRKFVQKDLGSKALVTGTIVFGPLGLYAQSDMDFIDAHAYWQHPRFPNRPWDSGDWLIDQKPMTDYPEQATLFRLAAQRLRGKPYTVSEYNHPAPLDSQAECVPMIASFAAAQDWDGLWLYTYSHSSDDWNREQMNSYFDIDTNPAKWAFMRAGTAIFRDSGVGQAPGSRLLALTDSADVLAGLAELHLKHDRDMFAVLSERTGISHQKAFSTMILPTLTRRYGYSSIIKLKYEMDWSVEDGEGLYAIWAREAWVFAGHAERFEKATNGRISIAEPGFVALTVTALDKDALEVSRTVLVTACGRCENTGMKFSEDRRTVGRNWGGPPVRIEPVEGTLTLPTHRLFRWTCQALGPDGMPKQEVRVSNADGKEILELSPKYKTMWYLLKRQSKTD